MNKIKSNELVNNISCTYYYDENDNTLALVGSSELHFINILKNFKNVKRLVVVITHLNNNSAGNLPSLISYSNCMYNDLKPEIVFPETYLKNLLSKVNISEDKYTFMNNCNFIEKYVRSFNKLPYISYSYIFKVNNKKIYYSTNNQLLPKEILYRFICRDIKVIYYDMTKFESVPCATISYLSDIFPKALRKKVYTVHLDNVRTKIFAKMQGFSIAN